MTASKKRGRPRRFDVEQAVATAQSLFHDKGYDAVGIAELTEAIGINPPSFYAAFGSKAALFERVLARYDSNGLHIEAFFNADTAPAAALRAYMEAAARLYASDQRQAGCLVFESARGTDRGASVAARARKAVSRERILDALAHTNPTSAAEVADYVTTVLSGLSAGAREGWGEGRLLRVVAIAAKPLDDLLT